MNKRPNYKYKQRHFGWPPNGERLELFSCILAVAPCRQGFAYKRLPGRTARNMPILPCPQSSEHNVAVTPTVRRYVLKSHVIGKRASTNPNSELLLRIS